MTKLRKTALAFGTACAIAFTGGLAALNAIPAVADGESVTITISNNGYYGKQLEKRAETNEDYKIAIAFYNELVSMNTAAEGELSEFRQGLDHEISDAAKAVVANAVKAYAEEGTMTLVKQFGAALDCFRYDYPDLFYINFDLLTINVLDVTPEPPQEEDTPEEESDAIPVPHDGEEEGEVDPDPEPEPDPEPDPEPEIERVYTVVIGAGRAKSYLLFDSDDLNGKTEEEPAPEDTPVEEAETEGEGENEGEGETPEPAAPTTLYGKYEAAYTALKAKVDAAIKGEGEDAESVVVENASLEDKVIAVNKVLGESFTYGFGNDYVNTTYVLALEDNKPNASSEGFARLFKKLMEDLNTDCLLVSGYYVVNGTAKACMWNYVKDSDGWYAVDVANNLTTNNAYCFVTGDVFLLDHFENGVVSLSNHKLEYPDLVINNYNVVTGALQVANGSLGDRNAIVVAEYKGEGGVLSIKLEGEEGWTALSAYELDNRYNIPAETTPVIPPEEGGDEEGPKEEGGEEEVTPEEEAEEGEGEGGGEGGGEENPPSGDEEEDPPTTIDATNCKVAYDEAKGLYYLFGLEEGKYQIAIVNDGKEVEINETVADSIKEVVAIPLQPNDKRLTAQPIAKTTITIEFGAPVQISEGEEVKVDFTVGALTGDELAFVKNLCTLGKATLQEDNKTLIFDFTPCALTQYSGLKYTFTFSNLIEKVEEGQEAKAVPGSYALVFKYENEAIKTSGVSVGSDLYTDIVTQPSLVFNNDLSISGWKYDGKTANDNMISALALSVGKTAESEALTNGIKEAVAANTTLFNEGAFVVPVAPSEGEGEGEGEGEAPAEPVTPNTVETYSLNLTLDGKAVTIPEGSYLKLAFPYPDGCEPKDDGAEADNTIFKVFQFKKDEKGNIDYANYEILDVVAARQGLVVAVNDPSATFAIVAFEKDDIKNNERKAVLTETSGVGGTVKESTGKPVNTLANSSADKIVYTITPKEGYELDYILVDGVEQTLPEINNGAYTFTLSGDSTDLSKVTYNTVRVEFKPVVAEGETGKNYSVSKNAASAFVKDQLERKGYSNDEKNSIDRDYPVGGLIYQEPEPIIIPEPEPPNTLSSNMQMIIILSIVGGLVVIGVISIIYCGAIRPKILREREEEAERIAAQRERRANRNKMRSGSSYDPRSKG